MDSLSIIENKQKFPVEFFRNCLEKNMLSRSYLFVGDAIEDKKELVKALNKILNCKLNLPYIEMGSSQPAIEDSLFAALGGDDLGNASLDAKFSFQEPCGECQNCQWIEEGKHPKTPINIQEQLEAAKQAKAKESRVELLRQMISDLNVGSEFYRLMVIEDASSKFLTKHLATAFLKAIEEAKANTLFILFADSKASVLSTIVSRSQIIPFASNSKPVFAEQSIERFTELQSSISTNKLASRLAQYAEAEDLTSLESTELTEILQLLQNDCIENIATSYEEKASEILSIEQAINDLGSYLRPKAVLETLLAKLA